MIVPRRVSLPVFWVALCGLGCAGPRTIMIPRFGLGGAATEQAQLDPFGGGEFFKDEREVDGRPYALRLVAHGATLFLGARVGGDFSGDVAWTAGDLALRCALDADSTATSVPVTGADEPLDAMVRRTADATEVVIAVPHGTLRAGDGALRLVFSGEGMAPVEVPVDGRLRGVYLAY